ncbi:hypothetical protein MKZ38_002044 [Zalerion maritima]|uniref:Uncharacterized protein n=1 Tax=Zalerion maritima TaxID=339359 RepID=A0AAD5RZE4_9PEZI|nr:hypothetical protein MKZ38_002044 [Zalerion maritima]
MCLKIFSLALLSALQASALPQAADTDALTSPAPGTGFPIQTINLNSTVFTPDYTTVGEDGDCTAYVLSVEHFTMGPTSTMWATTTTDTMWIDCGECTDAAYFHRIGGLGPVVIYNTTVTATEPSSTTGVVCVPAPTTTMPTAAGTGG